MAASSSSTASPRSTMRVLVPVALLMALVALTALPSPVSAVACPPGNDALTNCIDCNAAGTSCTNCRAGYGFFCGGDGLCLCSEGCQIRGCVTCPTNAVDCSACEADLIFDSTDDEPRCRDKNCAERDANCARCDANNDAECAECTPPYVSKDPMDLCVAAVDCRINNCTLCTASVFECSVCDPGFDLDAADKTCKSNDSGDAAVGPRRVPAVAAVVAAALVLAATVVAAL